MIIGHNISSHIRYQFDTETNCAEYSCEQEGICRCSTITNLSVTEVKFDKLVDDIYKLYFPNGKSTSRNNTINSILYDITTDIEKYTIDRILRKHKIWKEENLYIDIVDGYYGEEVGSITITENIAQKIEDELETALNIMSLSERMEYLLTLEYGHLIPELKNKKWSILEVPIDHINFGSRPHKLKVDSLDLGHYSDANYILFRGICIKSGDKWRLIDGYHRCSSTENKTVKIIVAE